MDDNFEDRIIILSGEKRRDNLKYRQDFCMYGKFIMKAYGKFLKFIDGKLYDE